MVSQPSSGLVQAQIVDCAALAAPFPPSSLKKHFIHGIQHFIGPGNPAQESDLVILVEARPGRQAELTKNDFKEVFPSTELTRSSMQELLFPPQPLPCYLSHATQARATPPTSRRDRHKQPRSPDHARSQREQRRHPAISHRKRCARTVKRPRGPVTALLQILK